MVSGTENRTLNEGEDGMRKAVMGIMVLLLASLQSGIAKTVTTAQDYAVDSDVVLESAVREIKSAPRDTINVVGDVIKMVSDETATAAKGVASVFKSNPVEKDERAAALETASAWNSGNDIVFRSYKVSESVGNEMASGKNIAPGTTVDVSGFFTGIDFPKGASAMYRPEFKRLFVRQTLENMLSMEDVLADLSNAKRDLMGKQVEIQTKFIEVSQSTLNELGFNWTFTGKGGGSAHIFDNLALPAQSILSSGLRTSAEAISSGTTPGELAIQKAAGSLQWYVVINALEQANDSDVLSAPSVTTRDGKTANIWVGEQRMVPKSFEAASGNTSVYVENGDWNSELMGVQLEVTPELRSGGLIDLELAPKVMDLIGYDTYQVTPADASMIVWARQSHNNMQMDGRFPIVSTLADGTLTSVGNIYNSIVSNLFSATDVNDIGGIVDGNLSDPNQVVAYRTPNYGYFANGRAPQHDVDGIPVPELTGSLPYFRIREMTTQVTVADGNTVGMGGLIYDKLETYKDKVPVLGSIPLIGRLFRSEGEKSVKRNLMIFVTATQVDVNGRRAADLAMKK
jgi:general secretion pathway protein D